MKTTTNYGFKKPEQNDFCNIDDLAENMDKVDEELKKVEESAATAIGNFGKIMMTSGKHKRMFFAQELVKTDSSGKATTNNIKDKIEALGGKWEYSATSVFGYAEEKGVMISASPDTLKSSDTYGTVTIRAYNADGSAHDDSGPYANTLVVLLIFTDEA
jgi:hypothetical protein